MKNENVTMELQQWDGKIWCRPIDAPRNVAWRRADGCDRLNAESITEAARELRRAGYRVTRRRSGL